MIMTGSSSSISSGLGGEEDGELRRRRRRRYLIVRPEKGGIWDLLGYALRGTDVSVTGACKFLEMDDDQAELQQQLDDDDDWDDVYRTSSSASSSISWVILVSIIVRKIISSIGKPMEYTGYALDFLLNLLSLNGGHLSGLLLNILLGKVVVPERGSETFISTIGHLDGRVDLYNKGSLAPDHQHELAAAAVADDDPGQYKFEPNRALMDLCIMASKLAYENSKVVQTVVNHHWKMHFVDFFNCWNDFQRQMSTQVFILCDKPRDAKLILISFRGTEPFDADDWCTDFDYSWYEIPKLGKVHMGFIEAMGLGNRNAISTFDLHLQRGRPPFTNHEQVDNDGWQLKKSAYYLVKEKLKSLLAENKDAKFVVTGHSLGGALAILFPTVLLLHQEDEVMKRLLGVYTFGQPRIGNEQLGEFMAAHLEHPSPKYFRVVYCNDLVPRLPYDDRTFLYKHFGWCLYYDSCYIEREEPNKNFFSWRNAVAVHLNAVWELVRSLTIGYTNGPEYREGWLSTCLRVVGVALPGISAHSPADYVNCVRLGTTTQHACLY